ncbi:hypothetical protein DFH29DRAFT_1069465 [Suillus ampliporus]|nr:hypothetical protein DFH29DRAFT_1069465 [Suillus ampliporus]
MIEVPHRYPRYRLLDVFNPQGGGSQSAQWTLQVVGDPPADEIGKLVRLINGLSGTYAYPKTNDSDARRETVKSGCFDKPPRTIRVIELDTVGLATHVCTGFELTLRVQAYTLGTTDDKAQVTLQSTRSNDDPKQTGVFQDFLPGELSVALQENDSS